MTEEKLHKQICQYIATQYPATLFNTDLAGVKLSKAQAGKAKMLRSCTGFPDIVIYRPGKYGAALFIEVKKDCPYKRDGSLKSSEHLQRQEQVHERLKAKGYWAAFVWTFEMAKVLIDEHLR